MRRLVICGDFVNYPIKTILASECDTNKMYLNVHFQVDSEEERLPDEKYVEELAKKLPQGTDKTPEVLEEALKGLPDK